MTIPSSVMAGPVPAIHVLPPERKAWMPGTRPGMTKKTLRQCRLDLADDRLEGRRLVDREIGEHLAVDGDAGLVEARDETAVIEAEGTHRGIEALDPQSAEGALPALAVTE